MPLIIVSGFPSSGKTLRSKQLAEEFQKRIEKNLDGTGSYKVIHIDDESLGIEKETYRDSRKEKTARAALYSAVERSLSKETFVICDSLNYIKGYRYQLFCEAKSMYTPHCVMHVAVPTDLAKTWNDGSENPYPDDVFEGLIFRYEEPNAMVRWDSPLFTVLHDDPTPPFDQMWSVLVLNKNVKPNQATVIKPPAEVDYLHELDKVTQEVTMLVFNNANGDNLSEVPVPNCSKKIEMPNVPVSLPLLQRFRRQFVHLNRQQVYDTTKLKDLFVDFLNGQFETLS
ncbi:elongator complex associated protein Kti2 [Schizosaccharomyces japonicus yFS275]|uniref:Elongator complex associated protein Kti2 n=1 Tax=Schizosaccharomyces japonicus (strain yFS275 / FY16936) TaxID=402676 RepID=B6JXA0_SCHJY|nr:elongator complex associated protein Kti2 [Schizosaccharomyces japonicus yFS275]EEB06001.1 elongator complex associated protein Kti2 [Schizosaccharomyces japonicus yFS275]